MLRFITHFWHRNVKKKKSVPGGLQMPSRMVLSPSEVRLSKKLLKIPLSVSVLALHVYIASENLSAELSVKNHKILDNK